MEPLVTNSAAVQSGRSTRRSYHPILGLTYQMMGTFWHAFIPQGHERRSRFFSQQPHTLVSEKSSRTSVFFGSQHLAKCPSMLIRKQPRTRGLLKNTPSTVWTKPVESLRTTPTSFNLLCPSQEHWCSTEFRRTRASWQQEVPHLERFWHAPQSQARNHWKSTDFYHGKWRNNH